jgi:hypothetical protein
VRACPLHWQTEPLSVACFSCGEDLAALNGSLGTTDSLLKFLAVAPPAQLPGTAGEAVITHVPTVGW